jgi:hypothetical protein
MLDLRAAGGVVNGVTVRQRNMGHFPCMESFAKYWDPHLWGVSPHMVSLTTSENLPRYGKAPFMAKHTILGNSTFSMSKAVRVGDGVC